MDWVALGAGLFGGAGIATLVVSALHANSYDDGYKGGRKDGYDQAVLDDARRSGGYIDSVRVLQRANRALNEERAQHHVEMAHKDRELADAYQVIAAVTTAAKLAAEAQK